MLKGFRDFITRGNVIDLAVGVVIGAAFTSVVTALVKSFLEPLVKLITGGSKASGTFTVREAVFDWGAFINAIIAFLLTAAAIYFFVVVPINKLNEMRARGQEPEPEPHQLSEEARLLTEIRDALLAGAKPVPAVPAVPAQEKPPAAS